MEREKKIRKVVDVSLEKGYLTEVEGKIMLYRLSGKQGPEGYYLTEKEELVKELLENPSQYDEMCSELKMVGFDIESAYNEGIYEGSVYTHYKGDKYYVLKVGIHTETNEVLVSYHRLGNPNEVFFRPLTMFFEQAPVGDVNLTGQKYRFELLK